MFAKLFGDKSKQVEPVVKAAADVAPAVDEVKVVAPVVDDAKEVKVVKAKTTKTVKSVDAEVKAKSTTPKKYKKKSDE